MATSGTATFAPEIAVLIEEAYERAGSELRSGYDLRSARRSLDIMSAEWSNRGLNLWTVESGSQVLTPSTAAYNLPADTVDLLDFMIRTGTGSSQVDYNLERIGVSSYAQLVTKNQEGRPVQVYIARTATPSFTLWPVPDDSTTYTFVYWRLRRIQDTGAGTNTMDVPSRFIPALVAGLAYYTALKKPESYDRVPMLKQMYDEQFQMAYEEDRDRSSFFIRPKVWSV